MKIKLLLFLGFFLSLSVGFCQNALSKKFDPLLSSDLYPDNKTQVEEELGKKSSIIRFLDTGSLRIEQELKIWDTFIQGIDREVIGLVFVVSQESDVFSTLWNVMMAKDLQLVVDRVGLLKNENEISDDYNMHSLLLNKDLEIIERTGSPIVLDNFDLMRSVLAHELKRQGYKSGVKGAITDPSEGNPTWLMGEPIYVTEDGQSIGENEFIKLLGSGKFYPKYTLSDTIKMIRRK